MEAVAPSRREIGKAERRARIVEAAAALVRESGFDAASMVQIADRAQVSPATLYNLFRTKDAIFRQVFDLDLEAYQRRLSATPAANGLERIFVAVELAASLYRADPDCDRAMARSSRGAGALRSAITEPRIAFWQDQVVAAAAEGRLSADADPRLLGVTLTQLFAGALQEWAAGVISPERLAQEIAYGFALALLAFAPEASAKRLRRRLQTLRRSLTKAVRSAGAPTSEKENA